MKDKKVHLKYSCDKTWGSLCSTDSENLKFCNSCNKHVGDFTKEKAQDATCGTFNISQVQSFKRNFVLAATSVPFITLLGLSLSPIQLQAQVEKQDSLKTKNVVTSRNFVSIQGNIVDKESKKPLEYGVMEVFKDNEMIAVTLVQKGQFKLKIDTTQYKIENLSVYFYNTNELKSDTTEIQNPIDQKYLIELDVQIDSNRKHLTMTGDYATIDNSPELTCTLKPVESKKKKRQRLRKQ
tara:strand:+ start:33953 stop:34666 length:714 start_codon:yes stop_codon:yes gene_type:complete